MVMNSAIPVITPGYRLQKNIGEEKYSLLYPEGLVELNDTAALVLLLCDGQNTIEKILSTLGERFPQADVGGDVSEFLEVAHGNGWIKYGTN